MYRQDADYKQALFLQGQDTLVVTGAANDGTIRIGAGAHISVPLGADAKFIGVDGSGLEEQRRSLENDYQRASGKGGQLLDTNSHERRIWRRSECACVKLARPPFTNSPWRHQVGYSQLFVKSLTGKTLILNQ